MQSAKLLPHQLDQHLHLCQFELHDQLELCQRMSDRWKQLTPTHLSDLAKDQPFLVGEGDI